MKWRSSSVFEPGGTHFLYTVHRSILADSGTGHRFDDTCRHSYICNADCSSCHTYQQDRQWSSFCLSTQANTDRNLNNHISTIKQHVTIEAQNQCKIPEMTGAVIIVKSVIVLF